MLFSFSFGEVYYYENGNKSAEGSFKNDCEDGKWIYYYESGKPSEEVTFKSCAPNGPYISYYENGEIEEEGAMKDGLEDGEWLHYYENGYPTLSIELGDEMVVNYLNKFGVYSKEDISKKYIEFLENI